MSTKKKERIKQYKDPSKIVKTSPQQQQTKNHYIGFFKFFCICIKKHYFDQLRKREKKLIKIKMMKKNENEVFG
jgi:hypothetical protein